MNEHWSPEQISNKSTNAINQVPSTSTIYRLIHAKKLLKTSMKNLKGQQKKEENLTIKGELLRKDLMKYTKGKS